MVVTGEPEPPSRATMTGIAVGGEAPVERSTTAVASDVAETPSPESSIEDDERRIQAVKNIFDAEEMDD